MNFKIGTKIELIRTKDNVILSKRIVISNDSIYWYLDNGEYFRKSTIFSDTNEIIYFVFKIWMVYSFYYSEGDLNEFHSNFYKIKV